MPFILSLLLVCWLLEDGERITSYSGALSLGLNTVPGTEVLNTYSWDEWLNLLAPGSF